MLSRVSKMNKAKRSRAKANALKPGSVSVNNPEERLITLGSGPTQPEEGVYEGNYDEEGFDSDSDI